MLFNGYQIIRPWGMRLQFTKPLQWRERDGVSNHRRIDCFLKLCSGADQRKHQSSTPGWPLWVKSTGQSTSQRDSNAENVSIWWLRHVTLLDTIGDSHLKFVSELKFTISKNFFKRRPCAEHVTCHYFNQRYVTPVTHVSVTKSHLLHCVVIFTMGGCTT